MTASPSAGAAMRFWLGPAALFTSLLGGLLAAAGMQAGWWWAVPLGTALVVGSLVGVTARIAGLFGAFTGALFTALHLAWLTSVGDDALLGVIALLAVWWALTFLAIRLVMNLRGWPLLVPAVWVLQEWLLSRWPLGGFPWARLGFATLDSPLSPLISDFGVFGMTYILVLCGCALAALVVRRNRIDVGMAIAVTLLIVTWSAARATVHPANTEGARLIDAAVIQGGPQLASGPGQARAVLSAHANQTVDMARSTLTPPDVILWPESSTDLDPNSDKWARSMIDWAVSESGAPIIVGAVTNVAGQPELARNQAIVWLPDAGPTETYTKSKLVPFGEYVPARNAWGPLASRFTQVPRDFMPGTGPSVLYVPAATVGVLICFEVAFDDVVYDAVRQGATVIAAPSNNATYQRTRQPDQQLAIARFRAIETNRAVLLASTTGTSAIILPDGTVNTSIGDGGAGWLRTVVPASTTITPAVRFGTALSSLIAVIGAGSVIAAAVKRRRLPTQMNHRWGTATATSRR